MEVSLPGEQVMPLPKKASKNKNKNKSKPNGFICFANAQRTRLASQYDIRGPQMLVELCDPLWRELTPDVKRAWGDKAKEEHARALGRKIPGLTGTEPHLRMDCNGKLICERQNAERAEEQRREREKKFVKQELDRCEEIMDVEFYIIHSLSTVEYLDGECVPCEVACVKCTIRDGILDSYHFFPDPGCLRPGHYAEALERCELEHEINPTDFPLASKDYELDVTKLVTLIRGKSNSPKTPLIFARSYEAKKIECCMEWLGYRVQQEFKPKIMQLESFIVDLVEFTGNVPPTFAQVRRLLFETKFDFVNGNRCDFHGRTDKMACAIGNVRKFFYFMSELLYDYFEFDMVEGRHMPLGFDNRSCVASSRAPYSLCSSVADTGSEFNDNMSVSSNFSFSSYLAKRGNTQPPRRPAQEFSLSQKSAKSKQSDTNTPEVLSQVSNFSTESHPNSFLSSGPRRPKMGASKGEGLTYDTKHAIPSSYKAQSVNSFSGSYTPDTIRSNSPVSGLVRGADSVPPSIGRGIPPGPPVSWSGSGAAAPRARGYVPAQPATALPVRRGIGRGRSSKSTESAGVPRKPNIEYTQKKQYDD